MRRNHAGAVHERSYHERMPYSDPIPELKRQLGAAIAPLVTGWNADDIGAFIGTDRARISELRRGKLDRFSLETLIRYLDRLRRTVELRVVVRAIPAPTATPARARGGSSRALRPPAASDTSVTPEIRNPAARAQGRDVAQRERMATLTRTVSVLPRRAE